MFYPFLQFTIVSDKSQFYNKLGDERLLLITPHFSPIPRFVVSI